MNINRLRVPRICVGCDAAMYFHTPVLGDGSPEDDIPRDGDWSICFECGAVLEFQNSTAGGFRLVAQEEIDKSEMKAYVCTIRAAIERRKKEGH